MPKQLHGLHTIQLLGQAYRAMMAGFDAQVGHALPRWRILLALHEVGECSQKLLAERCRLDPASLTRQLQSMESLGWISRAIDAEDNRLINAMLTTAGKRVVAEALPRRAAFFDRAMEGLSASQVQVFHEVLGVLEENFKAVQQQAR
jgi:DNA-binding MarR family transcriptional regulator